MLRICLIGGLAEALARIYWDHEHAVANGEWALWSQHESALFWFGHCSLTTLNRPCGKGPGKKRSCPQRRSHFCDPWISMICSVCPANFTVPCVPGSNLTTSHQPPPAHGYSSGHLATACDKVCSYGKTYSRSSRPVTTTEAWNQKGWRDLHSAGLCSHRVTLGRGGCWVAPNLDLLSQEEHTWNRQSDLAFQGGDKSSRSDNKEQTYAQQIWHSVSLDLKLSAPTRQYVGRFQVNLINVVLVAALTVWGRCTSSHPTDNLAKSSKAALRYSNNLI
jgi:hypothetical protein